MRWRPRGIPTGSCSSNYCDTCSLYDRAVFDAGLRYAEDILLGHEDWDLALRLASSGIRGEPAAGPTVLVRKHGFTRSDLVHHLVPEFSERLRRRHETMYERALGPVRPLRGTCGTAQGRVEPVPVDRGPRRRSTRRARPGGGSHSGSSSRHAAMPSSSRRSRGDGGSSGAARTSGGSHQAPTSSRRDGSARVSRSRAGGSCSSPPVAHRDCSRT